MSSTPQFFSTDISKEYYSDEGCHILEILNDGSTPMLSLARARVEVGKRTRLHTLSKTIELYYLLQGQGKVLVGDQYRHVSVGDCVKIDPDVDQSIQNTGAEDLVFLCICHPRFEDRHYRDTEL